MTNPNDIENAWREKLKAYLPVYYQQRRDDLEQLKAALTTGDWDKIARIGHKIKGSAATYGFPELGDVGAELECEALRRNSEKVKFGIEYIESWLHKVSGSPTR